jgi:hypothetical protein
MAWKSPAALFLSAAMAMLLLAVVCAQAQAPPPSPCPLGLLQLVTGGSVPPDAAEELSELSLRDAARCVCDATATQVPVFGSTVNINFSLGSPGRSFVVGFGCGPPTHTRDRQPGSV